MKIYSFEKALEDSKQYGGKTHLLLGNGFSIAWNPSIFTYDSLYNSIDFKNNTRIKQVFDALNTTDFEYVLRILNDSSKIYKIYSPDIGYDEIRNDYTYLQNLLIDVITSKHPEHPNILTADEKIACRYFLKNFHDYYTTNYDLLPYWVLMYDDPDNGAEIDISFDDGFRNPDEEETDYVTWEVEKTDGQNLFYLHGALHLFDNAHEFQKYTWSKTGIKLIDQIKDALSHDKYPMFVSEGTTNQKKDKIQHNGYLNRCLRSFSKIRGSLFIYGLSFGDNDEHIFKEINQNRGLKAIYISLYGLRDTTNNRKVITKFLSSNLKERVKFYDAESVHIWR